MKNIITLIGCGASGLAIASHLANTHKLEQIKLVDANISNLNNCSEKLSTINEKITYSQYNSDATKKTEIKKILKDANLVINSASPSCNLPIMGACLETNTNYIDLASDPFYYNSIVGSSLEDQLKLNNLFLDENLVAITNTGFSPGFTDIICKSIIENNSLDFVEYFKVNFAERIKSSKLVTSWSPYYLLLESILPSTVYKNGNIEEINFQQGYKNINFPKPLGVIKVKILNGHPELKTIPYALDIPINYVEIGGGYKLNNMNINDLIVEALGQKVKDSFIVNGDIFKIISSSFENPNKFVNNFKEGIIRDYHFGSFIELLGYHGNKTLMYTSTINHDYRNILPHFPFGSGSAFTVSLTPSIIAKKILTNKIKNKGVLVPGNLDCCGTIIDECKAMGLNLKETVKWSKRK